MHAVTHTHQLVFLCLHSACVIAEVFSYGGQPEHSYCIICADRFALAQSVSCDYFQCARKPPCCSWQGGTSKDEAIFVVFPSQLCFASPSKTDSALRCCFSRSEQEVRGSPLQGVVCSSRKQAAVNAPCSESRRSLKETGDSRNTEH